MTINSLHLSQAKGAGNADANLANMSAAALSPGAQPKAMADKVLNIATRSWFVVAVIGQWVFLAYLLAFYAPSTLTGNFQLWTKNPMLMTGYVAGDTAGNLAFAAHALLAAIIAFGGAVQLIPQLRKVVPAFHRWNGRVFMLTALCLSVTGLYMIWFRGITTLSIANLAISLNALFILGFSWLALRSAMQRDIASHRRWALRLYLVSNAQWFTRVGLFAWIIIAQGPVGMGANFDGPVVIFWSFGCYLVPLLVLELYLRTKQSTAARRKFIMASTLFVAAALTGVGTVGVSMFSWLPSAKAMNDPRISIADTLSVTILASGVDKAVQQYHELKSAAPTRYNFDQSELRVLGKKLIASKHFDDAISILRLNVEAYPQSARAYVRLAEGYLAAGNQTEALINCQKALKLDPSDDVALPMLQQLNANAAIRKE
jgi:tetratricopeptide (TPR) repeat protein